MEGVKRKIQDLKNQLDDKESSIEDLKLELKECETKVEEAENRLREYERKKDLASDKLDITLDKIDELEKLLQNIESDRDSKEKELAQYMNTEETAATTLEQQHYELKEAKDIAEQADTKYVEVARKLQVTEEELGKTEDRLEDAKIKNKELEAALEKANNDLNTFRSSENELTEIEDQNLEQVGVLNQQLTEAEALLSEKDREVKNQKRLLDKLIDEVDETDEKIRKKQEELEAMGSELADI